MYKILSAIVGSTCYGLNTPDSDIDRLGVYLAPTKDLITLKNIPYNNLTITSTSPDETWHELIKIIALAVQGNPSIIELFFLDDYELIEEPAKSFLIKERWRFLSTDAIYKSYSGYALAQMKKFNSHSGRFSNSDSAIKSARHILRLIIQGSELLATGNISVKLSKENKDIVITATENIMENPDLFIQTFQAWGEKLTKARAASVLPDIADLTYIDTMLQKIRYDYYWKTGDNE